MRLSSQNDLYPGTDARGPRRPGLRVQRRPDPQPGDLDQPAGHVLELPGHAGPPRRDGPGPPRRPADAEPVRPARAAWPRSSTGRAGPSFIGFDSTYRWRYLSEDYFDGFWARLVDRVGRNKALGGRFPFQVHLGKGVYRVGDRVSVGVRYTDPAALAEASELAAELEIAGQPPEPLRFEKVPDDPGLLTATLPGRAGRCLFAAGSSRRPRRDLGSGVRVSTTTFRVEPPRREIDEPSLNRPLLTELARLTGGRVFDLADVRRLDDAIPMREVTRTLETRDELWDAPLLFIAIIVSLTVEWVLRKMYRMV